MTLPPDDEILRQMSRRDGVWGRYILKIAEQTIANSQKLAQQKLVRRSPLSESYFGGWFTQYQSRSGVMLIGNKVPHAKYIEDGTRPHVIRPRPSNPTGRLWFIGVVNGRRQLIGVTKVNHPGTRAYNILTQATQAALRQPYNPNRGM